MDIIKQDFKNKTVLLKVEDKDDLWYLSHLIDIGDTVTGKTTRKIKIGDGDNAKVSKKTMTLTVEAEQVHYEDQIVRVLGKVKEETELVPKDSYHTISLEPGTEFTLKKPSWLRHQKQKLKESSEKKYNYLMLIFDREEALFALTKKFGYEILVKIKGEVSKKGKDVAITKDFQQEIIKALDVYAGRFNPDNIIIASPAFYKDDLLKKITNKDLKKKIVLAISSDVNEKNLDEVLRRPELASVLKSSRAREEQQLVDELLSEINKDKLAAYGLKDVTAAVQAGAVQKLLVTDNFIKKQREAEQYQNIDELMKQVDAVDGEIHIIASENDSGKKLDGLGGIAAILRYKLNV